MKFRFLIIFSLVVFCCSAILAQERNYELEISLEETAISKGAKEIPVKFTITNRADEVLKTSGLMTVHFFFSKCELGAVCREKESTFSAYSEIPTKLINSNESFEFEVNLADLYWNSRDGNVFYKEDIKNFNMIPAENIYFYARQLSLVGYEESGNGSQEKIPIYDYTDSNMIIVVFRQ